MAKASWLRSSPVVPSVALTLTAAALLVWHVFYDPAKRIDGWTVALLVVVFLPWLGAIFETLEFPGGGKVEWRKRVEAEQQRQASDIEALQFLLARFLTDDERALLQRLADDDPVDIANYDAGGGAGVGRLNEHLRSLHRLTLIASKPSFIKLREDIAKNDETQPLLTVNVMYDVTDRGRKYLELSSDLPDVGQLPLDPYRPA